MIWLLFVYSLLFIFIAWRNFHLALTLFFLLLPTYLIRFNIGLLPTTLLEIMFGIITIIWLIKFNKNIIYHSLSIIKENKILFIAISLFLISATISILVSNNLRSALGEWKAFYIEPIILFFILITSFKQWHNESIKQRIHLIIFALILSGLVTSLLAIYQHYTGWMVPYSFWENRNTFRITAWYGYPNAVGLFLAPLLPLAIFGIKQTLEKFKNKTWSKYLLLIPYSLFLILSPFAIIFSKGTGPLLGLLAGLVILLLFYKKTRWPILIIGLVGVIALLSSPQLINLKQEILFQDRSGQIRLAMWSETLKFLKDQPLSGAGLASYSQKIIPYHKTVNGEGIEIFSLPHNLFLSIWVNLGLLGLLSFLLVIIWFIKNCLKNTCQPMLDVGKEKNSNIKIFIFSSMVTILVMGLVDTPYIKNDLSFFFWLLPALLLISHYDLENS